MISQLIQAIGAAAPFTSRAFLPAFLVALFLRLADLWEGTQLHALAELGRAEAPWFTHWATLLVLGSLATLEIVATKKQEARELLNEIDVYLKPGMAFVTTTGVLSSTEAQILETTVQPLPAGFGATVFVLGLLSATLTFVGAWIRRTIVQELEDADPDDSIGIHKAIAWLEDLWAAFLVVLMIVVPIVVILVFVVVLIASAALERWMERRAEASRVPCAQCGAPAFPHAVECGSCRAPRAEVVDVGFFGQPILGKPSEADHRTRLRGARRCASCATRLRERTPHQHCSTCQTAAFPDAEAIADYELRTAKRERAVLLFCAAVGLFPVLGTLIAVVAYRLALVSPYRRWLPRWQSIGVRWGVRLLNTLLFMLAVFPFAGLLVAPAMAFVSHRAYRGAFTRLAKDEQRAERAAAEQRRRADRPDRLAWLSGAGARRARPFVVAASALLPLIVVALYYGTGHAETRPTCPEPVDHVLGTWQWEGFFAPVEERFEPDGVYVLNGFEGRWTREGPGRLRLEVGPTSNVYRVFVTDDDVMVYVADRNERVSIYARQLGARADVPAGCPDTRARAAGRWESSERSLLLTGESVSDGERVGVWESPGAVVLGEGDGAERFRVALSEADELLLLDEGGDAVVLRRSGAGASSGPAPTVDVAAVVPPAAEPAPEIAPQRSSEPLRPDSVAASSFVRTSRRAFPPELAFDGRLSTAWNEGADGPGDGQWIEARFDAPITLHEITLATGWDHASANDGEDLFARNSHARRVAVTVDGEAVGTCAAAADQRRCTLSGLEARGRAVRLTFVEVYPGTRWSDLAIPLIELR